jgi:hypothetical protein
MSSTPNNGAKENATTKKVPAVISTKLPILNRVDDKSLDLQQSVNNFTLFYGDISEPPSVQEQKYVLVFCGVVYSATYHTKYH